MSFGKEISSWITKVASFIGLAYSVTPLINKLNNEKMILISFFIFVLATVAIYDLVTILKSRQKKYQSKKSINNYMHKILSSSGSCEICSRDATWISDERILPMLEAKAKKNELTFLVLKKTPELKKLERYGATIIEYGKLGFQPLTRFTIVNASNPNSSFVAIGRHKPNQKHIIDEIDNSHPSYSLAKDLVNSVKKTYEKAGLDNE